MSEITYDYKWVTSHFNDKCSHCEGIITRGEDALYGRGNLYCEKCAKNIPKHEILGYRDSLIK